MSINKRENQQKDLKNILAKDIGAKNPIFSTQFIADFHQMFWLYADPRQGRADIRDILMTAKTLGLDTKHEIVFRAIEQICEESGADAVNFEGLLTRLTHKVGNPYSDQGRRATFSLLDIQGKGELDINDLRYINEQLKYGYKEDFLEQLIKTVGGFGAETITVDKFVRFIKKKVESRKINI